MSDKVELFIQSWHERGVSRCNDALGTLFAMGILSKQAFDDLLERIYSKDYTSTMRKVLNDDDKKMIERM